MQAKQSGAEPNSTDPLQTSVYKPQLESGLHPQRPVNGLRGNAYNKARWTLPGDQGPVLGHLR